MVDVIIIGAGPAGLTAAIYAARSGLNVTVFDRGLYGGQVANTSEIENYPAIKKISGAEFSISLYEQTIELGVDVRFEEIIDISIDENSKGVTTPEGTYQAKTIIIATGVKRRLLGCPGEEKFTGMGVSYCATCDGAFFKGKDVLVVGGGNTALEDALYLSNNCNTVYLAHRRDTFRGEHSLVKAVNAKKNIKILYDCVVKQIYGDDKVNEVRLKNLKTNKEINIKLSGVFVAIGMIPDNSIFKDYLELDKQGYIVADENCNTSVKGVFVAGDTRNKLVRQIITAASDGAIAATQAINYINAIHV